MPPPPIAFVIAGIVLIMVMARYFPSIAGWMVLALTLGLLLVATERRVI